MLNMFQNCSGLTSVTIGNNVTSIGNYAFYECRSLTSFTIPNNVTSIGDYAFSSCSGLTSVTIGNNVTSIGNYAFYECRSLTSVHISDIAAWCKIIIKNYYSNPLRYAHHLYIGDEEIKDLVIPNSVTSIGNETFSGCIGLTSVSIPNSVTSIGKQAFFGCTGLTSVTIGNSVTSIGQSAFFCKGLTSVTSLIEEPFGINDVFFNSTYNDAILYVPATSVDAYETADGWKNFKNIVEIGAGSTLNIIVINENSEDLTDKVSITWYDVTGKLIGTGNSISGIEEGTILYYSVELEEELGRVYREVNMKKVVVESEAITCQLKRIEELTLHGKVESEGEALNNVEVSLTQWLNGKYEYAVSTKTGENGEFTLKAYNDSTLLTISAKGYVDKKIERSRLYGADLGTIELEQAQGMVISLQLSYQEAVREGEEPTAQSWYSDTRNISYTIRNVTKDVEITDFSMQMGDIVLPFGSEPGDCIQVTLRSLNDKFVDVSGEGVVNSEGVAEIALRLVAYGGVEAVISNRVDDQVLVMLYGSDGKLVSSSVTSSSRVTFTGLKAGSYTSVTMGYNGTIGSVNDITDLETFGMVDGSDYVMTAVTVQDGIIGRVTIDDVPELDVSKFEYTSLNTSYLPNKTRMTLAGPLSYITLTVRVDFKTQYANEVSDVKLIIDIPEGCELITNSVVTGTKALPHTLIGNQLTITLSQEDIDSRIRFCITPKTNGIFASTAYTEFNCRGEKRQSIGTAVFEATAGSISVPSITDSKTITINGIAAPHAIVNVYDDDQLIGTTTALGDGKWRTEVELYKPYNLSTHEIYAKFQTVDGISATTESQKCLYDMNQVKVKSVIMSFYNGWMNKNISVVFDFETGKTSNTNYSFYTATNFTFVADLTVNDSTIVKGVTFYVHTTTKEVRQLKGFFDVNLGRWVAVSKFDSNNLPVNLAVEIETLSKAIGDRQALDDNLMAEKQDFENTKAELSEIDTNFNMGNIDNTASIYRRGLDILANEDFSEADLQMLFNELSTYPVYDGEIDETQLSEEFDQLIVEADEFIETNNKESIYSSFNLNIGLLDADWPSAPYSGTISNSGGECRVTLEKLESIDEDELLALGFEINNATDGSKIYSFASESEMIYIDSNTLEKYTLSFAMSSSSSMLARRNIYGINPDLPFMAEFKLAIALLENVPNMGTSSSDEVKAKVKVLESVLNHLFQSYTGGLTWFSNKWTTTATTILQGIDGELAALELLQQKYNSNLLKIHGLHEIFPTNVLFRNDCITALGNAVELERRIDKLKKLRVAVASLYEKAQSLIKLLPKTPTKMSSKVKVGGKLLGGFGAFIEICGLYEDTQSYISDLKSWQNLQFIIENKLPCPGSHEEALNLQKRIISTTKDLDAVWSRIILAEATATGVDIASISVEMIPLAELIAWGVSGLFNVYAEWSKLLNMNGPSAKFLDKQLEYSMSIGKLKCKEDNNPEPSQDDDNDSNRDNSSNIEPPFPPITPIHDPSGYVYEAVPTNRVQGVTATIYYDQSNPTLWDAADFSQVNPQVTDETGLYQWDVPQGMWQVRFEKAGYETTQTDWLPVPPPQLEINIPMSEAVAPTVVKALGMESGITLDFSKYMKPSTLVKSGRVSATVNGKNASGDVELLNLEEDPYNNKEYASKVKFVPLTAFKTTDEVVITVKKEVESYADKQMDADFVAKVKIEPEIKGFACDSVIAVDYQGSGVLEIAVLPAAAAKGRTVSVSSTSTMIATTDEQSVTLNDEGKATITVNGNLPGGTSLHLQLDGMDIEKYVEVSVVLRETVVKTPKASKRSGSTIEADYLLWLTCNTPGATIYYTLDGSCPCDETKRIKYTGPFVLPAGEVTLKAVAVRQGMEDSEVVTYTYIVECSQVIVNVKNVQNLPVNATYAEGVLTIIGAEGCTVRIFDLLGRELASRQNAGNTVSMKVPQAESYIVSVTNKDGQTVVRKVSR